jgi:hypothetical protein
MTIVKAKLPSESTVMISGAQNITTIILDFTIHPKDQIKLTDMLYDYCRNELSITENFACEFNKEHFKEQ